MFSELVQMGVILEWLDDNYEIDYVSKNDLKQRIWGSLIEIEDIINNLMTVTFTDVKDFVGTADGYKAEYTALLPSEEFPFYSTNEEVLGTWECRDGDTLMYTFNFDTDDTNTILRCSD